jgi:excisionase family DNA binding protein
MKTTEKKFYLVSELAVELRVCEMTIYRYIKNGKLKANKIGKGFRITSDEYKKFLSNSETK